MSVTINKKQLMHRSAYRNGWTKTKRAKFLDEIAATCNQSRACAVIGMSRESLRLLRQRDPEFAVLFAEAVAAGTERLQQELVAHSLGQLSNGDNPDSTRAEPETGPFDAHAARETLKTIAAIEKRRGPPRDRPTYATDAELTLLLADRLDALAKRLGMA